MDTVNFAVPRGLGPGADPNLTPHNRTRGSGQWPLGLGTGAATHPAACQGITLAGCGLGQLAGRHGLAVA